jgi:hypothetical protein
VVLRDALFKYYVTQQDGRFFVADDSDPPIYVGNVVGFDEHEAALLVFVDYHDADTNPLPNGFNFRTLVGVRADRFTTRQAMFYANSDCAGPPVCIAAPGAALAHNLIQDLLPSSSGTISYLNSLQGNGPSYAVGRNLAVSATQDLLFRSSALQCDVELTSMWVSQTVSAVTQDSCINIAPGLSGGSLAPFRIAEALTIPGSTANVLEGLTPPFYTNMIGNPLQEFTRTAPRGEGL